MRNAMTPPKALIEMANVLLPHRSFEKAGTTAIMVALDKALVGEDDCYEDLFDEYGYSNEQIAELCPASIIQLWYECATWVAPATPKKVRKVSYQDKIRAAFDDRQEIPRIELMEILGCDQRNVHVAVSIIRNPKRVKETMDIRFNKKTLSFVKIG